MQTKIFVFGPFRENTYLFYTDDKQALVIDPGMHTANEHREFWAFLHERGVQVTQIWLTHAHLDHMLGSSALVEKTKVLPCMHALEQPLLDQAVAFGAMWNVPVQPYTGPCQHIHEQTQLSFGGARVEVRFVPGHSPGSLAYYWPEQGWVVSGDTLFQGSIGRTDLPGGNHDQLLQSIRSALFTLSAETIVYPGHGAPTTVGKEKGANPFFQP